MQVTNLSGRFFVFWGKKFKRSYRREPDLLVENSARA